ncbi:ion transporter [Candidatus Laterigemmans baculatus]|uniref:ion transporter n=1 Tax=Candidatus Laterigemmans baculatus TaxID=2770505 RepID=UPI001F46535B|nr:ion transporter [Candidatus Laterigemmans baculatus]
MASSSGLSAIHPPRYPQRPREPGLRRKVYDIIFESDTFAGRLFDIVLLIAIFASIIAVATETLPHVQGKPGWLLGLKIAEFIFAGLFCIEYGLRVYCSRYPWRYVLSFWGVVDLLSFLPALLFGYGAPQQRSFAIIRAVRLLRVFRILKLWRILRGADELSWAVWRAREKIIVFLAVVLVAITISGTLMYHLEYIEPEPGELTTPSRFSSIPQAMYWAIVTMTTVGYGDIVPLTTPGKVVAAALILLGYSLIIVPTGFVSAEITSFKQQQMEAARGRGPYGPYDPQDVEPTEGAPIRHCWQCSNEHHAPDANYCDFCGTALPSRYE